MSDAKKPTREQELKTAREAQKRETLKEVTTLQASATERRRKLIFDSAMASGEHGKVYRAEVEKERAARDKCKRQAEQDYQQALRTAQGERDKAIRLADSDFEAARELLDKQLREKTGPIEASYNEQVAALDKEVTEKALVLRADLDEKLKIIDDELAAIEAERKKTQTEVEFVPSTKADRERAAKERQKKEAVP